MCATLFLLGHDLVTLTMFVKFNEKLKRIKRATNSLFQPLAESASFFD